MKKGLWAPCEEMGPESPVVGNKKSSCRCSAKISLGQQRWIKGRDGRQGGGHRGCYRGVPEERGHSRKHCGEGERDLAKLASTTSTSIFAYSQDDSTCVCAHEVTSVVSDSLWPHGLQPTRLLSPWDSPGKNTGMGCHAFLQGIFPTHGLNLHLLSLLH